MHLESRRSEVSKLKAQYNLFFSKIEECFTKLTHSVDEISSDELNSEHGVKLARYRMNKSLHEIKAIVEMTEALDCFDKGDQKCPSMSLWDKFKSNFINELRQKKVHPSGMTHTDQNEGSQ